jgi:hypothetical protein
MNILSASDIVPNLYDDDFDQDNYDNEDRVNDLKYDVYNLVACDYHAIRVDENESLEDTIKDATTRATQLLINR